MNPSVWIHFLLSVERVKRAIFYMNALVYLVLPHVWFSCAHCVCALIYLHIICIYRSCVHKYKETNKCIHTFCQKEPCNIQAHENIYYYIVCLSGKLQAPNICNDITKSKTKYTDINMYNQVNNCINSKYNFEHECMKHPMQLQCKKFGCVPSIGTHYACAFI